MPSMTTLTKAEVKSMVMEILNVSKATYGTFDNSPLYKDGNIDDAVFTADDSVVNLILNTPGHPRRVHYVTETTFSTPGVMIPLNGANDNRGITHIEIIRNDDAKVVGEPAPASKISNWIRDKANYGGDDCVDGYYDITDGILIFSGKSVELGILSVGTHPLEATNLFSPPEYKSSVAIMAARMLVNKDPERRELVNDLNTQIAMHTELIIGGSEFTPPFEQKGSV